MQIIETVADWQRIRKQLNQTIGFVPTMGNLHAGHLSLVQESQKVNALTVVSLFINPKQFNDASDFARYPRTLDADLKALKAQAVDYCLLPSADDVYADRYRFKVTEEDHSLCLEGQHRPGHFTGVLTVVMKLLNLVSPNRVYLGEKDYQQYCLIRDMTAAFFMPVEVIVCPTIREASKLALSSRNNLLTAEEKVLAEGFAKLFHQGLSDTELRKALEQEGIIVDYLEVHEGRRYIAIRLGKLRLIDNYQLSRVW